MNPHRKIKIIYLVPCFVTLIFVLIAVINPPVLNEFVETLLVDYRFKVRNFFRPPDVPDNIVIVAIDEESLKKYGRWPWNRKLQAELIERIYDGNPSVIGIDIFYPEAEDKESDRVLAKTLSFHRDNLVIALGFEAKEGRRYDDEIDDVLYDYAITKIKNVSLINALEAWRVLLPPEPIMTAAQYGHVYSLADRDGKLRWENLYIKYGDEYFPSFPLQLARLALGKSFNDIVIDGGREVRVDDVSIPTDEFGRMHINYLGREKTFPYISAASVLSRSISTEMLNGKIVLIGTSALATYDLKNTPFSANMPGVEKHATVIANILQGNFVVKAPAYLDVLIIILTGLLSLLPAGRKRAIHSLTLYISLLSVLIVCNFIAFFYGIRFNLVYPLFNVLGIGTFTISFRYLIEERKAREIRKMFSSYVTERIVNELVRNPDMAKLGGERREVTVMFSDISGFTSYSEKHAPEEVVSILNEYLTAMTEVVFRWEGTLDKFIGDAIVAFWGAPLEQKNHAELAVRCALHMMKRLNELQQKWESEGRIPLNMGIGLNTGEVLVGNIGAEGRKMDYTVIGDHVNTGARVESLTRKFNANILMTELPLNQIMDLIKSSRLGHVSIKGVGTVIVKGKEKPVRIYEIKSLDDSEESVFMECEEAEVIHMKEK